MSDLRLAYKVVDPHASHPRQRRGSQLIRVFIHSKTNRVSAHTLHFPAASVAVGK